MTILTCVVSSGATSQTPPIVSIETLLQTPDISRYVLAGSNLTVKSAPELLDPSFGCDDLISVRIGGRVQKTFLPKEFPVGEFASQANPIAGSLVPLCLVALQPIGRNVVLDVADNVTGSTRISISASVAYQLMLKPELHWFTEGGEAFYHGTARDVIAIFCVPRTTSSKAARGKSRAHRLQDRLFVFLYSGPDGQQSVYKFDDWVNRIQPERQKRGETTFLIQPPSMRMRSSFIKSVRTKH